LKRLKAEFHNCALASLTRDTATLILTSVRPSVRPTPCYSIHDPSFSHSGRPAVLHCVSIKTCQIWQAVVSTKSND